VYSVKEYSSTKGVTESYVYKLIKQGKLETKIVDGIKYIVEKKSTNSTVLSQSTNSSELEKENIRFTAENEFLKQENIRLKQENEEFKYDLKQKNFEVKKLLEKMENLNDKVIGLIEWKSKSWWQKILGK